MWLLVCFTISAITFFSCLVLYLGSLSWVMHLTFTVVAHSLIWVRVKTGFLHKTEIPCIRSPGSQPIEAAPNVAKFEGRWAKSVHNAGSNLGNGGTEWGIMSSKDATHIHRNTCSTPGQSHTKTQWSNNTQTHVHKNRRKHWMGHNVDQRHTPGGF